MEELKIGNKVFVNSTTGIIRFIGSTSFALGNWVGVELEKPFGKNDGSVQGTQYFQCEMKHGVFVRPSQIKLLTTDSQNAVEPQLLNDSQVSPIPKLIGAVNTSQKKSDQLALPTPISADNNVEDESTQDINIPVVDVAFTNKEDKDIVENAQNLIECSKKVEELEKLNLELTETIELVTLDKEMAEERLEFVQQELEELKMKIERDSRSNSLSSDPNINIQNELLKEALIKLRNSTDEKISELTSQIQSLNEQLLQNQILQEENISLKLKMENSESQLQELKDELDSQHDIHGVVEKMSERLHDISEENEKLKNSVEELEALKELADELEISHVETEKQLQREIDSLSMKYQELVSKVVPQNSSLEETVRQYRDLVMSYQKEIEVLKFEIKKNDAIELPPNDNETIEKLSAKLNLMTSKIENFKVDNSLLKADISSRIFELKCLQESFHQKNEKNVMMGIQALSLLHNTNEKCRLLHEYLIYHLEKEDSYSSEIHYMINFLGCCFLESRLLYSCLLHSSKEYFDNISTYSEALGKGQMRIWNEFSTLLAGDSLVSERIHLLKSEFTTFSQLIKSLQEKFNEPLPFETILIYLDVIEFFSKCWMNFFTFNRKKYSLKGESKLQKELRSFQYTIGNLRKQALDIKSRGNSISTAIYSTFSKIFDNALVLHNNIQKIIEFNKFDEDIKSGENQLNGKIKTIVDSLVSQLTGLFGILREGKELTTVDRVTPPWQVQPRKEVSDNLKETEILNEISKTQTQLERALLDNKQKERELEDALMKNEILSQRIEQLKMSSIDKLKVQEQNLKWKEQEKVYEEALESLQKELDDLEMKYNEVVLKEKKSSKDEESRKLEPLHTSILESRLMTLDAENNSLRRRCMEVQLAFLSPLHPKVKAQRHIREPSLELFKVLSHSKVISLESRKSLTELGSQTMERRKMLMELIQC